jgi:hypothetical protein
MTPSDGTDCIRIPVATIPCDHPPPAGSILSTVYRTPFALVLIETVITGWDGCMPDGEGWTLLAAGACLCVFQRAVQPLTSA